MGYTECYFWVSIVRIRVGWFDFGLDIVSDSRFALVKL